MAREKLTIPQHIIDEAKAELNRISEPPAEHYQSQPVPVAYHQQSYGPKRQSDVAIANAFVTSLLKSSPVVVSEGELWQYSKDVGIWTMRDKESLKGMLHKFDGSTCNGKPIHLSDSKINGIFNCMMRHPDIYDPGFFDDPVCGVQCKNGFLALHDAGVQLIETAHTNKARFALPLEYHSNFVSPKWTEFLATLFPDDTLNERSTVLQEFLGLCLVGQAAQYAKAFILIGEGANGKSTFLEHISRLFPSDALTSVVPQKWKEDYFLSKLRESMLNICNEMPTTEIMGSDVFKAVVTGESITARLPYGKPFNFVPQAGHVFACNVLPYVSDHSFGFWRRFIVIDFHARFTGKGTKTKDDVLARLEQYLPDTLTWAIAGANNALLRRRYHIPKCSAQQIDQWRRQSDAVALWVDETGVKHSKSRKSSVTLLYQAFARWAKDNGYRTISLTTFSIRFGALGFQKKRTAKGQTFLARVRND